MIICIIQIQIIDSLQHFPMDLKFQYSIIFLACFACCLIMGILDLRVFYVSAGLVASFLLLFIQSDRFMDFCEGVLVGLSVI